MTEATPIRREEPQAPTVGERKETQVWGMSECAVYLGMSSSGVAQMKTQRHLYPDLFPGPPFRTQKRTSGLPRVVYHPEIVKDWCRIPKKFEALMKRWSNRQHNVPILRGKFPPFYYDVKDYIERHKND